jgi:hypothetical protein
MRHATQMGGTSWETRAETWVTPSETGIRPGIGGKSSGGDLVTHFIHCGKPSGSHGLPIWLNGESETNPYISLGHSSSFRWATHAA